MSKNAKIVWTIVAIIVVVGIVGWGIHKNDGSSNVIKIGFIEPLSGDASDIGVVNEAAVKVAVAVAEAGDRANI